MNCHTNRIRKTKQKNKRRTNTCWIKRLAWVGAFPQHLLSGVLNVTVTIKWKPRLNLERKEKNAPKIKYIEPNRTCSKMGKWAVSTVLSKILALATLIITWQLCPPIRHKCFHLIVYWLHNVPLTSSASSKALMRFSPTTFFTSSSV